MGRVVKTGIILHIFPAALCENSKDKQQVASSWEMRVNAGKKLQFPEVGHIAIRPHIVLWSVED
ncbi:hypothetical protein QTP70_017986, partial [Hemibagrus guttatus]